MTVRCHKCGAAWEVKGPLGFRDECPECAAFMHACVNCRHYEAALTGCRLPNTESVRDRSGQNFCEEFEYGPGARPGGAGARSDRAAAAPDRSDPKPSAEEARKRFERLFRKGGP